MFNTKYTFFYVCFLFLVACQKEETNTPIAQAILVVPQHFPQPNFPTDNTFTPERFALGKRLFYDPILSKDSTISCASCHHQQLAFTDGLGVSEGIEKRKGTRNASALINLAYAPLFLREGGVPTLEMQILVPISEHAEMDDNILNVAKKLNQDSSYIKASLICYGRKPDPYVITRAIATYERALISGNSRYDNNNLTNSELQGKNLFFSERLACATCHEGFNFTNYTFENNGLYKYYKDPGRYRLTLEEKDSALFKVPTLRNIEKTAPYMHDGSLPTLEAVVAHYNSGGKAHRHKNKLIKPLNLSLQEQQGLVAFLKSLTDNDFLNNKNF
jgi:cytochrome c peroxidase